MRRYMAPQRRLCQLASERLPWMSDDQRRRMQDIAERLGRGLDEIDSCIARTAIMSDEIAQIMQESLARRTYTMSLMAMVFLPSTFLTGLFGVNLGGILATAGIWGLAFSLDVSRCHRWCCVVVYIAVNGCKESPFSGCSAGKTRQCLSEINKPSTHSGQYLSRR